VYNKHNAQDQACHLDAPKRVHDTVLATMVVSAQGPENAVSPTRLASPCTYPGCPALTIPNTGRCERHQRPRAPDNRPSFRYRGYGAGWAQIRLKVLLDEPRCRMCQSQATVVDHIDGDVENMNPENLQPMCVSCHNRKTVTVDRGGWARRKTQTRS